MSLNRLFTSYNFTFLIRTFHFGGICLILLLGANFIKAGKNI